MNALAAYEAGLVGRADCWLHRDGHPPLPVPIARWTTDAGAHDEAMVGAAVAAAATAERTRGVVDVGCGPGRLTRALVDRGVPALGIDVSRVAVRLARRRGVPVVRCSVFDPVVAEGEWAVVLLADGNIGIGGDPVRLLRRCRQLLAPGGSVLAEVQLFGGVQRGRHWLEALHVDGGRTIGPLRWATVGADAVVDLGAAAGLSTGVVATGPTGCIVGWSRDP